MPQIRLTGYLEVPADRLEAVLAALPEHVALTRAEPGCVEFSVRQSVTEPERLEVSELFASPQAFDAHQARAGSSPWAQVTRGLKRVYEISEIET